MKITGIVCIDKNNGIGKDNNIPWNNKEDKLHFKKTTTGHTCIVGKNTYNSLPTQPR